MNVVLGDLFGKEFIVEAAKRQEIQFAGGVGDVAFSGCDKESDLPVLGYMVTQFIEEFVQD
jgi:hypothetical protein